MAAGVSEFLFTFSLNLYKQLHADHGARGNILCSPFGVAAVLSMTLAGARNNTEKQILNVLQANNGSDRTVHEQFEAILDRLETLAPDVSLFIANRIYASHEFAPLPGYASLLQKHYHSSLETVDFQKNPDGVRRKMNSWVEVKTGSRIKDFFPPGTPSPGTRLVALNAVFFKGLWESQFSAEFTSREEFHGTDGTAKMVDMMSQRGKFRMAHSRELGATALEILYKGARVFMVVLLPDARDGLPAFERKVTPSKLSTLLDGMTEVTKVCSF
ncbi:serpin B4-like [Ixodes scapularis]